MHHAEGAVAVDQVRPSNVKKKIVFWSLKKCTARGKAPPSQTYAMSLEIMNSDIILRSTCEYEEGYSPTAMGV